MFYRKKWDFRFKNWILILALSVTIQAAHAMQEEGSCQGQNSEYPTTAGINWFKRANLPAYSQTFESDVFSRLYVELLEGKAVLLSNSSDRQKWLLRRAIEAVDEALIREYRVVGEVTSAVAESFTLEQLQDLYLERLDVLYKEMAQIEDREDGEKNSNDVVSGVDIPLKQLIENAIKNGVVPFPSISESVPVSNDMKRQSVFSYGSLVNWLPMGIVPMSVRNRTPRDLSEIVDCPTQARLEDKPLTGSVRKLADNDIGRAFVMSDLFREFGLQWDLSRRQKFIQCIKSESILQYIEKLPLVDLQMKSRVKAQLNQTLLFLLRYGNATDALSGMLKHGELFTGRFGLVRFLLEHALEQKPIQLLFGEDKKEREKMCAFVGDILSTPDAPLENNFLTTLFHKNVVDTFDQYFPLSSVTDADLRWNDFNFFLPKLAHVCKAQGFKINGTWDSKDLEDIERRFRDYFNEDFQERLFLSPALAMKDSLHYITQSFMSKPECRDLLN